jgi:hypothetical protein
MSPRGFKRVMDEFLEIRHYAQIIAFRARRIVRHIRHGQASSFRPTEQQVADLAACAGVLVFILQAGRLTDS